MGKKLSNPLIASSCIATETADGILKLAANGVQGAILKSCADYEKDHINGKRQFACADGCTYASSTFEAEILTLPECIELMHDVRSRVDILLIPSFTANSLSPDEWLPACKKLEDAGADAVQLDFFYMGSVLGTEGFSEKIVMLLTELVKNLNIPVMPKLNVNLPKDYIMPLLVKAGIEYVSLLDSVRCPYYEFDKENNGYRLSGRLDAETTSCFGHWQLPLTISYTFTAVKHGLKTCAGGGITGPEDVKRLLAAGATTVQSATFLTKYPHKAQDLITGLCERK